MRIAIDAQPMLSPDSKNRGIGNYNFNHFNALFSFDEHNEYDLFNIYGEQIPIPVANGHVTETRVYTGANAWIIAPGKPESSQITDLIYQKYLTENPVDIFHITSPFDYWPVSDKLFKCAVSTVATVYDLIPYIFKDRYLSDNTAKSRYMKRVELIRRAGRVMAISNSVKEDLIHYLNIDENKIDVINAGVGPEFLAPVDTDEQSIRSRYKIDGKFIMCTGGGDERKNMRRLVKAFSMLPKYLSAAYQLVLVCGLTPDEMKTYKNLARGLGIENRLVLTGFVPQNHLVSLYKMADVFAFPSLYEGFGLPVLEAMACGTPVITSDNSSLREIGENAALLVDAGNVNSIRRELEALLSDSGLRDQLIKKGSERVKRYTWENVARDTLKCYEKVMSEKASKPGFTTQTRPKFAFFTPLNPKQSGISDYSEELLPALKKYADIDIFIDDGYQASNAEIVQNFDIHPHRDFPARHKSMNYDKILYQMGNSEFHEYMIPYIRAYPGTLVLHDYNLHGLVHYITNERNDTDKYHEYVLYEYGQSGKDYIKKFLSGHVLKMQEYPLNGFVADFASDIIVHSTYSKKKLLEKDIGRKVGVIPSFAKLDEYTNINTEALRKKYDIPRDQIVVASFGHIAATKRIDVALHAFAKAAEACDHLSCILVGKLPQDEYGDKINKLIQKLGLAGRVTVTGYTSMEAFVDYINICDICINLRYPYNGETSGSLMRVIAAGKPCIVTDIGSFSELPDDCCFKIPAGKNELKHLTDYLSQLIGGKEILKSMGERARSYARENLDLNKVAKMYFDFLTHNGVGRQSINENTLKKIADTLAKEFIDPEEEAYRVAKTLARCIRQ